MLRKGYEDVTKKIRRCYEKGTKLPSYEIVTPHIMTYSDALYENKMAGVSYGYRTRTS
jgi:hypothetical protein